ncbi:CsgG/HfaB family protein [Devosia sp.]|uniref:CsgG/HfaB family protein n=1 Tax=Devosia sp. TaxID=1871048 RepID=UPI003A94914F
MRNLTIGMKWAIIGLGLTVVTGCASTVGTQGVIEARLETRSAVASVLDVVPPPAQAVSVAVYDFPDRTGQFARNDDFAESSRAVTQGATSILIDVLKRAGGGKWFEVVEREGLKSLMTERDLIQQTRAAYQGSGAEPLPALRFAGVILEGGIVGYDSNVSTGGAGAAYLGIGSNAEHRTDIVTISLRAVSVSSGKVLTSVTTTKTIYSVMVRSGLFMYAAADRIAELEGGYSRNEPRQVAVREAIELAVVSMIVQGVETDQYSFANAAAGKAFIGAYRAQYIEPRLGVNAKRYDRKTAMLDTLAERPKSAKP